MPFVIKNNHLWQKRNRAGLYVEPRSNSFRLLLKSIRGPASGQFVMLGKTFKGLTDLTLQRMTDKLLGLGTFRDDYTVYVKPELVAETAYNDIRQSPRYPGGLALGFARVKRLREDKPASEADTIQTVWAVFEAGLRTGCSEKTNAHLSRPQVSGVSGTRLD
jgi:ATP-dependent DNA ligase